MFDGALGWIGSQSGTPPSTLAGPLHTGVATFCAVQVQADGQSESLEQEMVCGTQVDVGSAVVVHPIGADASCAGWTSTGTVVPDPDALPDPVDPPEPVAPPPEHSVTMSGVQVKPGPQSLSTLQGGTYLGTQDEVVVVVQPASNAGTAQSAFGGQLGAGAPAVQAVLVCV